MTQNSRIRIHGLAHGGAGVGRVIDGDGPTWFVEGALPGEVVEAQPEHEAKRFVRGRLVEVIEPGPARVQPPCPVALSCGGCAWQHVQPQAQAALKRDIVADQLRRVLAPERVKLRFEGKPEAYRRRARMHYRREGQALVLGFLQSRSHEILDIEQCPILVDALDQGLQRIRAVAPILPEQGEVLGLSDGTQTVLGLPGVRPEPETMKVLEGILDDLVVGVEARGGRAQAFVGRRLLAIDGGAGLVPMRASAFVFTQAQADGNRALTKFVARAAAADGQRVLELFAGAGNFTRALARTALRVFASDSDRESVELLRGLAKEHGLPINAKKQSAAELLRKLAASRTGYSTVVLDPPRAGLGKAGTEDLCRVAQDRIVYISCDPATLARDLAIATTRGFAIADVSVFDLMPMTPQVEIVATLVASGGAA